MMKTTKFVRKPLYVEAIRVTKEDLEDIAVWCGGTIKVTGEASNITKHILVDVPRALTQRQKEAYVGDWVLKAGEGFKVYTNAAFRKSFQESTYTRKPRVEKETPPVVFNVIEDNRQGLPYPPGKSGGSLVTREEWEALSLKNTRELYDKARRLA